MALEGHHAALKMPIFEEGKHTKMRQYFKRSTDKRRRRLTTEVGSSIEDESLEDTKADRTRVLVL